MKQMHSYFKRYSLISIVEVFLAIVIFVVFGLIYFHDSTQGTFQLLDYRQGTYYYALALQLEKGKLGIDSMIGGDWLHYKGMYYLYFGPFPALIWLFLKNIGITLTFSALTLILSFLNLVFFYLLLRQVSSYLDMEQIKARVLRLLVLLLYAVGPLLFVSTRYFIYETAIVCGSTLLLGMMLVFFPYITRSDKTIAARTARIVVSGILLACVFLTRYNLILVAIPVVLAIIWREVEDSDEMYLYRVLQTWFMISIFLIPFMFALWGITIYNAARFGDAGEFGIKYSIIGNDHSAVVQRIEEKKMTGLTYLVLNTVQLAVLRPYKSSEPPYVSYNNRPDWLIGEYPRLVDNEFMSSIFISSPFLLFMFYPFYKFKNKKGYLITLLFFSTVGIFAYLYGGLSMAYARRYIQDYYAFLMVLTFIGLYLFWSRHISAKSRAVRMVTILLFVVITLYTFVLAGNLNCQVAYTGDFARCLRITNPPSSFKPLSMLPDVKLEKMYSLQESSASSATGGIIALITNKQYE